MRVFLPISVLALVSAAASAQQTVKVARPIWSILTAAERESIQSSHVVAVIDPSEFGTIIDNQGVDESRSGTNGGAALGSALAQTTYIDRALRGGNYSATNQLGLSILGAIVGSSLDKPAVAQYHFRYTVKLGNGEIRYFDVVQGDAFRHPVGVCVSVPLVALIDQNLCELTTDSFRAKYVATSIPTVSSVATSTPPAQQSVSYAAAPSQNVEPYHVECKLGNLAAVSTTLEKCQSIGGRVVP